MNTLFFPMKTIVTTTLNVTTEKRIAINAQTNFVSIQNNVHICELKEKIAKFQKGNCQN